VREKRSGLQVYNLLPSCCNTNSNSGERMREVRFQKKRMREVR